MDRYDNDAYGFPILGGLDRYHQGATGTVFDGRVDQVNLGWDVATCQAVNTAVRFAIAMSGTTMPSSELQLLREAVADLDFRVALEKESIR